MVQHRAASCQPRHALFAENVTVFSPTCDWAPQAANRNSSPLPHFEVFGPLRRERSADLASGHATLPSRCDSAPEQVAR